MYLFFWERALENNDMPVARVARVCKTDAGIYDTRLKYNVFSSFVKVQLQCSSEPVQSDTATTKVYTFIGECQAGMPHIGETGLTCRHHIDLSCLPFFPHFSLSPSLLSLLPFSLPSSPPPHWYS